MEDSKAVPMDLTSNNPENYKKLIENTTIAENNIFLQNNIFYLLFYIKNK